MSHDRGCYKCGRERYEYKDCSYADCPKASIVPYLNAKEPPQKGSILSGETIRELGIITPFSERTVTGGLSGGLSVAGYDIHIAEDVHLQRGKFALASTIEHFSMPNNVVGKVWNKSSWARCGLLVWQTILEPGWRGYLTLEMTNLGQEDFFIEVDQPIAQVTFEYTDKPTKGYSGKYQDQEAGPQVARFEK